MSYFFIECDFCIPFLRINLGLETYENLSEKNV